MKGNLGTLARLAALGDNGDTIVTNADGSTTDTTTGITTYGPDAGTTTDYSIYTGTTPTVTPSPLPDGTGNTGVAATLTPNAGGSTVSSGALTSLATVLSNLFSPTPAGYTRLANGTLVNTATGQVISPTATGALVTNPSTQLLLMAALGIGLFMVLSKR